MAKNVIGTCQLCFEKKVLIKGHIFPKWSSRLDGEGAKYFSLTNEIPPWHTPGQSAGQTPQGSPTEYLFCGQCDSGLGVGEGLLRQMIHPSGKKPPYISEVKDFGIQLKGEPFISQFYLALGGLLLKAHLSKKELLKDFILTRKQRNLVFNGMLNSSLSKNMEITLFKIYSLDNFKIGNFTDKLTTLNQLSPFALQYAFKPQLVQHGVVTTTLVFGGVILRINLYPRGFINSDLSPELLNIPISAIDIRYLLDEHEVLSNRSISDFCTYSKLAGFREVMRKIPLDSKCPCMVHFTNTNGIKENLTFGSCCYNYWRLDQP